MSHGGCVEGSQPLTADDVSVGVCWKIVSDKIDLETGKQDIWRGKFGHGHGRNMLVIMFNTVLTLGQR